MDLHKNLYHLSVSHLLGLQIKFHLQNFQVGQRVQATNSGC